MADEDMIHAVLSRALTMVIENLQPSLPALLDPEVALSGVQHEVDLHLRDGRRLTLRMEADIWPAEDSAEVY